MRNQYPDCLSSANDPDSVWNIDPGLMSRRARPVCIRRLERSLSSGSLPASSDEEERPERAAIRYIAENYERFMK